MSAPPDILGVRVTLSKNGYDPVVVAGKAPVMAEWQTRFKPTADELRIWTKSYQSAGNTGVLCKFVPGLDLDVTLLEAAEALETLARERFEERGHVLVRIGKPPKRLIPLRTDEPFSKLFRIFTARDGSVHRIELLGDGQQYVVHGTHPDHAHDSKWGELNERALSSLDKWVLRLFPTAKRTRAGGYRVKSADLGRGFQEDLSLDPRGIKYFGIHDMGDPRQGRRTPLDVVMEWEHLELDEAVQWLEQALGEPPPPPPEPDQPVFDPWERYIVPPFPLEILPPIVRAYVDEQRAIIGCDVSGLAMAVLAAFSGALHHGFALKMMRNGAWCERPRLWVLLVADVSKRKTPIITAVTRPLHHYETHLRVKYEHELRDYEEALAMQDETGIKPRKPEPPPRYIVHDTTTEALGEVLTRNDKGLLIETDEVSGWLGSMERYANSGSRSDRAFWLKAYDGGPYSFTRIKRGELFVKNLSVSIVGGIQPTRLAELQGLTSDGLLQRFLPVMMGSPSFPLDCLCNDESYHKLVQAMILAKPARLIMTDDALVRMGDLRKRLFDLEQASGGLAIGFQSFIGKLHGLCGSLALILHMADNPQSGAAEPVDEHTVENVCRLVLDFILPHAFEFYCGGETADGERLRKIASWILTSGKDRVLASDVTTNVSDCRGLTQIEVNQRLSPLVAAGWLIPADRTPVCRSWTVAPQVHVQLAERAKVEEARKAELAALIGSPRKPVSGLSGKTAKH